MNIIVIPARMNSHRLPGKPLMKINGTPLLEITARKAMETSADRVVVASEDKEILDFCSTLNVDSVYAKGENGTERVCAAAREMGLASSDIVVNLQCDEPFIFISDLNRLLHMLGGDDTIYTLVSANMLDQMEVEDTDVVKVVASNSKCHWFSRSQMDGAVVHFGVYRYPYSILRGIGRLRPTDLSRLASLEQLTWIEFGFKIAPVYCHSPRIAINSRSDIAKAEHYLSRKAKRNGI